MLLFEEMLGSADGFLSRLKKPPAEPSLKKSTARNSKGILGGSKTLAAQKIAWSNGLKKWTPQKGYRDFNLSKNSGAEEHLVAIFAEDEMTEELAKWSQLTQKQLEVADTNPAFGADFATLWPSSKNSKQEDNQFSLRPTKGF
jgi:hypothetical protein